MLEIMTENDKAHSVKPTNKLYCKACTEEINARWGWLFDLLNPVPGVCAGCDSQGSVYPPVNVPRRLMDE